MYLLTLAPSIQDPTVILYWAVYSVGFYDWKDRSTSHALPCMYLMLNHLLDHRAYYLICL